MEQGEYEGHDNNQNDTEALLHDSAQSPKASKIQIGLATSCIVALLVNVGIGLYKGITVNFIYALIGLSLVGFVIVNLFIIRFIRNSDLPKSKRWFLYLSALVLIVQSVFVDIQLF